jgi:CheY-like chemotaxis protein
MGWVRNYVKELWWKEPLFICFSILKALCPMMVFLLKQSTLALAMRETIKTAVVFAALSCSVEVVVAQDDPFGEGAATPAVPAKQATTKASSEPKVEETNVVVLSIRDTALSNPQQYAQAFVWLARIGRWDEIGRYLEQLKAAKWSQSQLAELLEKTDSALWIGAINRKELSDDQRAMAREVLDAAHQNARSPEQLNRWIVGLSDQQPGVRAKARQELVKVDFPGLQRLAGAVASGEVTNVESLAAAILEFGSRGIAMMEEMTVSGEAQVVERATEVLAKIGSFDSASALCTSLHRTDASESAKKIASQGLQRLLGYVPSVNDAQNYLRSKMIRLASEAESTTTEFGTTHWVFSWDQQGSKLAGKEVSKSKSLWSQADREAKGLRLLGEMPADVLDLNPAIRFQNSFVDNPILRDDVALASLKASTPAEFLTPEFLLRIYRIGKDRGWIGTQIRALQMFGEVATGTNAVGNAAEVLAEACGSTNPGIRYAGFESIAKLDPQYPYAGSHRVVETALELMKVGAYPQALVAAGFSYQAGAISSELKKYGYDAVVAGNARETLRRLDEHNPYELVVIAGSVADMSLSQFVQRVSQSRYSSGVPIIVVAPENEPARRWIKTIPQAVCVEVMPADAVSIQELFELIRPKMEPVIATDDRLSVAVAAGGFLKKIGDEPELYSFYNLDSMESEFEANLGKPAGWIAADSVLGSFGSAEGQIQLANRVADPQLDAQERQQAAARLVHSIRKHGVRMDRKSIQLQYDRYNRIAAKNEEEAKPMGWILDAMEARAGMRDWPELPEILAIPAGN